MANETIEIYLNSKSASNYLNNQISDCFYNLPSIEILQDEIAYINLKDAVIPYSFYNVNNTNNKLDYILNSVNYSITLINGYYNVNTLRTHLLDLLGVNCTILYISKLKTKQYFKTRRENKRIKQSCNFIK